MGEEINQLVEAMNAHDLDAVVQLFHSDYHSEQPAHPALLLFPWVGSGALRRVRGRSSQVKGAWRRRCREGAARPP